jgi:CheY-like chemotaxis protein
MRTKKKILLAEDDNDDQQFFLDFLGNRHDIGLISTVENGEEVFEYLDSTASESDLPDAIILDQNMPKRNGLKTLELLKQSSQYAHIPVMIYSTYTDETLIQKSTASGAALVMPKPATPEGYHNLIDELFRVME